MKKSIIFLFSMAIMASFSNAQTQKHHILSISMGKPYASETEVAYSMILLLPNGSQVSDYSEGTNGKPSWNYKIGYEWQFNHWFSLGANYTGVRSNSNGTEKLAVYWQNGQQVRADFPYKRDLRTGLLNVQALFDVLKSDKYDLKLGMGPSAYSSKNSFTSETILIYEDNANSRFYEETNKTVKASDTGVSYFVGFNYSLSKTFFLQSHLMIHQFNDKMFTMLNLGLGWKFVRDK